MAAPPRIPPGVIEVAFEPTEEISAFYHGDRPALQFQKEPDRVRVVIVPGEAGVDEITSHDRFCEFEPGDLEWALPAKLCRIQKRPYQPGDRVLLKELVGRDCPQKFSELELVCITDGRLYSEANEFLRMEFLFQVAEVAV